jgi:hypothetical protein
MQMLEIRVAVEQQRQQHLAEKAVATRKQDLVAGESLSQVNQSKFL